MSCLQEMPQGTRLSVVLCQHVWQTTRAQLILRTGVSLLLWNGRAPWSIWWWVELVLVNINNQHACCRIEFNHLCGHPTEKQVQCMS